MEICNCVGNDIRFDNYLNNDPSYRNDQNHDRERECDCICYRWL